jgi:hypothetical protein
MFVLFAGKARLAEAWFPAAKGLRATAMMRRFFGGLDRVHL